MYPLISKWFIVPGKEADVIPALTQLAVNIQNNEPGTLAYLVHTPDLTQPILPPPSAGEVIFYEIYQDEAAFQAHLNGKDFNDFVAQYGNMFVSAHGFPYTTVEMMSHEAGVIRQVLV